MWEGNPANTTRRFIEMKRGKRYIEAAKKIDRTNLYDADEGIQLVKSNAVAKFDETIEIHREYIAVCPVSPKLLSTTILTYNSCEWFKLNSILNNSLYFAFIKEDVSTLLLLTYKGQ